MDFDDLLIRYFGQTELETVPASAMEAGAERMRVDFGLEQDADHRFGLWTLMHMLGVAPDLDVAFDDEEDREAARDFMDMIGEMDEDD